MSEFLQFDGRIGIRRDERTKQYAVILTGGLLSDPVQLSAKRHSPSETTLWRATVLHQIAQLVDPERNAHLPEDERIRGVVETIERGKKIDLVARFGKGTTTCRLTFDLAEGTLHFHHHTKDNIFGVLAKRMDNVMLAQLAVSEPIAGARFIQTGYLTEGMKIMVGPERFHITSIKTNMSQMGCTITGDGGQKIDRHPFEPVQVVDAPIAYVESEVRRLLTTESMDDYQYSANLLVTDEGSTEAMVLLGVRLRSDLGTDQERKYLISYDITDFTLNLPGDVSKEKFEQLMGALFAFAPALQFASKIQHTGAVPGFEDRQPRVSKGLEPIQARHLQVGDLVLMPYTYGESVHASSGRMVPGPEALAPTRLAAVDLPAEGSGHNVVEIEHESIGEGRTKNTLHVNKIIYRVSPELVRLVSGVQHPQLSHYQLALQLTQG